MSGYGLTLKTEGTRMVSRELTHMAPESKITTSLIVTIKVTVCFDFFSFCLRPYNVQARIIGHPIPNAVGDLRFSLLPYVLVHRGA